MNYKKKCNDVHSSLSMVLENKMSILDAYKKGKDLKQC